MTGLIDGGWRGLGEPDELAEMRAEHARGLELIGMLEADQVRSEGIIARLEAERDALRARLAHVDTLVEVSQWARNRLEIIADESWHGDGRDLKRSIIGIFADFDTALLACGSTVPAAIITATEGLE